MQEFDTGVVVSNARSVEPEADQMQTVTRGTVYSGYLANTEIPAVARVPCWWSGAGSNRRPPVFQTGALPAELPDHRNRPDHPVRASSRSGGSDGI